jgi:8-oxo-dGTP pyrophosphatase MutT (NUDIX family)
MLEFDIIVHGFYRADQLVMHYDPTLHMSILPQTQAWMDAFWQEQLDKASQRNARLFNTPLFRYIDAQITLDQSLHIVVSDTSYKEYVTTRAPAFSQGRARYELGNPLAVCSVVETSDGYILLDKRQGVDVYVGRYHVIGGFFERSLDAGNTETTHANIQPDPFAAIRREIREETGIQSADIGEQYCLGIVYDLTTPHAEMCFLTRLLIPLQEVQNRQPEDNEIKQLIPFYVTEESLRTFIFKHHGNISATGEPNLLFYGAWKFSPSWLTELIFRLQS